MDSNALKDFSKSLLSRKFILALVAAIVAFGNSMWNWGLTSQDVSTVITPLLVFIGVEGAGDLISRLK